MTVSLRFRLPQEDEEYRSALRGADYKAVLDEITEEIRRERKWSDLTGEAAEVYNKVWQVIWSARRERGLEE